MALGRIKTTICALVIAAIGAAFLPSKAEGMIYFDKTAPAQGGGVPALTHVPDSNNILNLLLDIYKVHKKNKYYIGF